MILDTSDERLQRTHINKWDSILWSKTDDENHSLKLKKKINERLKKLVL